MKHLFRALPSMDLCLSALEQAVPEVADAPRPLVRELAAAFLDGLREDIRAGRLDEAGQLARESLLPALREHVERGLRPRLRRVLNATGVVIHTNMGRSVLAEEAREAVNAVCSGYCNLELDLSTGGRGSRYSLVEDLLCRLTGAEAALVVNNNAAAVLLVLDTLCKGGEVVVSRGQLVEIGGSFRIPEIMQKSGAVLREVGATNRTHLRDYADAVNERTTALLRVHTSNYRIVGFHKDVPLTELVELAARHDVPVIEDLGSGSLLDFSDAGLPDEPTVQSVVRDGAHIVTFSGDKVLGGPQAGIILGRRDWIRRLRGNPLNRALRTDKLTMAALEATLRLYLDPDLARRRIPTLRMITAPPEAVALRARKLAARLRRGLGSLARVALRPDVSRVGGGAFPERDLPTTLVCIVPGRGSATALKQRLLTLAPPLLGRLEDQAFCLDARTLADAEFAPVAAALIRALREGDIPAAE